MNLSDYLEERLVNRTFRQATDPFVDPVHIALCEADPGEAAAVANEVSTANWTNYARQAVQTDSAATQFTLAATDGEGGFKTDNSALINFGTATISGGDRTIKALAIMDAATSGNQLFSGPLMAAAPKIAVGLNTGDIFHSAAHGFVNDNKVAFVALPGLSLPTGVSAYTEYFVISAATDNFQVSATQGGAAVALTTDGHALVFRSGFKVVQNNDPVTIPIGSLIVAFR